MHSITGKYTVISFGKHNLNSVIQWALKKKFKKIVVASDNDGESSFIPEIIDDRLILLRPDTDGQDFNDCQDDISEQTKLKTLSPAVEYEPEIEKPDDSQKSVMRFLKNKKQELLKTIDSKTELETDFFDDNQIIPKNNFVLLSGDTEAGKTQFTLKFIEGLLQDGVKVIINEHDETNRFNRLNKWISDIKPKGEKFKEPLIEENRLMCLQAIEKDCVFFIDDLDSFMQIQNIIDRRQVADSIGALSWLCQLRQCTIIGAHFMTKSSKAERDIKSRSGGSSAFVNKTRYGLLIEKGKTGEVTTYVEQTKDKRHEEEERSYIYCQKGQRDKTKPKSFWLNDDYSVGESINKSDMEDIMAEKLNPKSQSSLKQIQIYLDEGIRLSGKIAMKHTINIVKKILI